MESKAKEEEIIKPPNAYFFNKGIENTFLSTIKIFLEDIKSIDIDRNKYFGKYVENPRIENINLFYSRAKHIEQMLILGTCGEYLLKIILIKHNFIINQLVKSVKFDEKFISKLKRNRDLGLSVDSDQVEEVNELSEKNIVAKLSEKTKSFEECIQIFDKEFIKKVSNYFLNTPTYSISNESTKEFYGSQLTYPLGFRIIQKIRNNYGHVPESKDEEKGILPFLYNFLVFVTKKEFPDFFNDFKNFKE